MSPRRRSSDRSTTCVRSSAPTTCSPRARRCASSATRSGTCAWDDYEAAAVVQPASVEEIQAIVRDRQRAPRAALDDARRAATTATAARSPRVRGSVVVNLRRMNRVLEINEELGYAVVEPGVSWFDLYEAITAGRAPADALQRRPRLGQRDRQHARPRLHLPALRRRLRARPAGMEVVLANGELLRTGMGAMPGNRAWHLYKRGLGPTLDQLFMQSNYGVVAKMGVWLMPCAGDLRADLAARLERRRPRADHRHAAPALARRDDPDGPADRQHADLRVAHVAPRAVVRRRRPDPRGA